MKKHLFLNLSSLIGGSLFVGAEAHVERNGYLEVEAEAFSAQHADEVRRWYRIDEAPLDLPEPDGDETHLGGASGGAYLELLPDTRRTHDDPLLRGENFMPDPGEMAILTYKVEFNNPGRYYCWVRAYSTGTEDNGLHLGINGEWPESGSRMQWTAKKRWQWDSKQRTQEKHSGELGKIWIDVPHKGEHSIQFSMREDGFEFDKFILTKASPEDEQPAKVRQDAASNAQVATESDRVDGQGEIQVAGTMKVWQPVTLTLDGPFAHEQDQDPNPFTDLRFSVTFAHEESGINYTVPGYFAADGNPGETSAQAGTKWRAHLSPDVPGDWSFETHFEGEDKALYDGLTGSFVVSGKGEDEPGFYAEGRLQYRGEPYLQFADSGRSFIKAGADAPETLLGYADFDGTEARKRKVPLKTYDAHRQDWKKSDPTWKNGKGKGLIGALNYLASEEMNAVSFLTYNAGGDGDNVWPFVSRDDKFHYDCSKLDQWNVVFTHAQAQGIFLHFKLQETENDDRRRKKNAGDDAVDPSLDGGDLGPERSLYLREMIARFGHHLALNWNLGEENTQSTEQQLAMARLIQKTDPYGHHIVLHTYPNQQDKVYRPHLGEDSVLTGLSLQNSAVTDCHHQVVKWAELSAASGKKWAIAFDEPGSAGIGMPADPDYPGMPDDYDGPSIHDVRKYTLWGTLLAGGWGVEYYFGYKLPQNDLNCEDWRSRDRSWDYCRYALRIFEEESLPLTEMTNHDELIGNPKHDNSRYCLAKPGAVYLIYLPEGGECQLAGVEDVASYRLSAYRTETGTKVEDRLIEGSPSELPTAEGEILYIVRLNEA
ncbi:MAG: DUF5060 domain-containing protein [Verrucomicrobiota bacterium JB023]|nr:DUF5060 domain-containing protein [Verrucomicrobiota bacterium JB023]